MHGGRLRVSGDAGAAQAAHLVQLVHYCLPVFDDVAKNGGPGDGAKERRGKAVGKIRPVREAEKRTIARGEASPPVGAPIGSEGEW